MSELKALEDYKFIVAPIVDVPFEGLDNTVRKEEAGYLVTGYQHFLHFQKPSFSILLNTELFGQGFGNSALSLELSGRT